VLLPEVGNTSAVLHLATARWCAAPAISLRRVSSTNTAVAISAAVEFCVRPAASLLLADGLSANAGVRLGAYATAPS
jgi:hypothetical protein